MCGKTLVFMTQGVHNIMAKLITYVEIPVTDIERAAAFYGAVFEQTLDVHDDGVRKFAMLSGDEGGASLTQVDGFAPNSDGPLVYFDSNGNLDAMMKRVADAGGKVVRSRESLGNDFGFYAMFNDTEGNTLALYENPPSA